MTDLTRPGDVAFHASRIRNAWLLLASVVLFASSLLMVRAGDGMQRVFGWLGIVMFGAGIPLFLREILDRRPRLVIGEQGIFDWKLGIGVIPWSEVVGAEVRSISHNEFVALTLRNPARFTAQYGAIRRALTSANRKIGFGELNLYVTGLSVRGDELLELIRRYRERR